MNKALMITLIAIGVLTATIVAAYWWANVSPSRPQGVSRNAVFLWSGHLGLPAPKHGTWMECWTDQTGGVNKCKLTDMNGTPGYEGVYLTNTGHNPVSEASLKIKVEPTSDVTHWVSLGGLRAAPLVFLENGTVLIPKDRYQDGMAKLRSSGRGGGN